MSAEGIVIESGEMPKCPGCGEIDWRVKQRIYRESDLEKVDKFSDLKVVPPTQDTYRMTLVLECNKCEAEYVPQPGVEAYYEGGNGSESGYAFPERIPNDWVEDQDGNGI